MKFIYLLLLVGCVSATNYEYWNVTTNITLGGSLQLAKGWPAVRVFFYDATPEANVGFIVFSGPDWGIYIKKDKSEGALRRQAQTLTHEVCHYRQFIERREILEPECCKRAMSRC